jgi:ribosomal protein L15
MGRIGEGRGGEGEERGRKGRGGRGRKGRGGVSSPYVSTLFNILGNYPICHVTLTQRGNRER